jgi:DNA-binding transcriptional MerR regulator
MGEKRKYSIGQFSEKTNTSIRTLHYYDEIGLLTPEKDPHTGHRWYDDKDLLTLHQIVSLKFLGFSLDQIKQLLSQSHYDLSLKQSLLLQKEALEAQKEKIETALKAIQRTISILEEEGAVDGAVIASLIHSMQMEKEQRKWLEERISKEVVDQLYNKSDEEMAALDKVYVRLSKKVKQLVGKPPEDSEVQELIEDYMKVALAFVGDQALDSLSKLDLSEAERFAEQIPSPFTPEEEEWLMKVMEHYMKQHGMLD